MSNDEWKDWPKLGTRVRVPYGAQTLVGEITAHRRMWISGTPVAEVRVQMPRFDDPYENGSEGDDYDDYDDYDDREEHDLDDYERDAYGFETYEPSKSLVLDIPMAREELDVISE